jgi:hypothetical protein
MNAEREGVASVDYNVTTLESSSAIFNNIASSGLMIERIGGSTALLTVYSTTSNDGSGTYKPVKNRDGIVITVIVDGTNLQVVDTDVFPCSYLKFVGDAAGAVRISGKS